MPLGQVLFSIQMLASLLARPASLRVWLGPGVACGWQRAQAWRVLTSRTGGHKPVLGRDGLLVTDQTLICAHYFFLPHIYLFFNQCFGKGLKSHFLLLTTAAMIAGANFTCQRT